MSWFDATGFASLAKTALKEAQKTIDKALDIKEDESDDASDLKSSSSTSSISTKSAEKYSSPDTSETSDSLKVMKQSVSNPIMSTVATASSASNLWGSFTGSFFDAAAENNETSKPAVTIAPTSRSESRLVSSNTDEKSQNINISGRTSSASESVELLSSPLTPSSGLTSPSGKQPSSPSIITLQHSHKTSDSIEIINDVTSCEALSPDSVISTAPVHTSASCTSISDSVEVIDASATFNVASPSTDDLSLQQPDDEDESVSQSYNTVSESTAPVTILDPSAILQQKTPNRNSLILTLPTVVEPSTQSDATDRMLEVSHSKPIGSLTHSDRSLEGLDIQTIFSDSTQSFEDIQQILMDEVDKGHSKHAIKNETLLSPQSTEEKNLLESKSTMTSDHNSGHTSADEIETATSSDIEIISGPNGDSSSHTSSVAGVVIACKPSKLPTHSQYVVFGNSGGKRKGHYRDLSEASTYSLQSESGSDGCSHSDYEKLAQRIAELTEVIENRECKLVQLGRENAQLHEQNAELKSKLDALQMQVDSQGMNTDDYTQRMTALERKFQQTLRERDTLRSELKSIQANYSKSISKDDIDKIVKEKDTMIAELRVEGEKLSKQILQHSTITKKLRSKERETDLQLKKQSEQIEELTLELERIKKSLSAKEDVEKSQIQAIHKLTSEKQKLVKEVAQLKSELDDTTQRLNTVQTSFDAARKELTEKQQEHYSLEKKAKNLASLQTEQQTLLQQNQQLIAEIDSLREKMKLDSIQQVDQLQKLRQENTILVRRLEEIEQRSEDQAHAITEATIPLVKQCQSLQSTLNTRTSSWEKQEMAFLKRIETLEKQLANVSINEQSANEQSDQLNARIQHFEESLSKALLRSEQSAAALQQKQMELELVHNDYKQKQTVNEAEIQAYKTKIDALNENIDQLHKQLKESQEKEQLNAVAEKPKLIRKISSVEIAENSVAEYSNESDHSDDQEIRRIVNNSSPVFSVGKMSANDSAWQLDDLDSVSTVGVGNQRRTSELNSFGSVPLAFGGGSAAIETLQSSLKQRDGENHQLQWELSRLQSERNFLLSEVSTLTSQLEGIKDKLATHESVVNEFKQLQEQYDAILQMYGEKVEETEELQLDLQDVKDMYRQQIDDLLLQHRQLQQKLLEAQQRSDEADK